jgi:hypothetical protein
VVPEFSDERIRIELRRLVEDFEAATHSKLDDVVSEAERTEVATELHVRNIRDKIEASKVDLSHRVQQIMNFIDRQ